MSRPATPRDLEAAGYRIEFGEREDGRPVHEELEGRYWWTWSEGSGIDTSDGDWATPEEAIANARDDMRDMRQSGDWRDPPEDTPCLEDGRDNCNDHGTGEGQFHGRM